MRIFIAFLISLLVYALLIWLFMTQFSNIKSIEPHRNEHIIKIDIRDIPLPVKPTTKQKIKTSVPSLKKKPLQKKPKKVIVKKVVVKKPIHKKKPIPKKKKPIVRKKPVIKKPKPKPKKIVEELIYTATPPVQPQEVEEEIIYIPEPIVQTVPQPQKDNSDDLSSFFSTPSSSTSQQSYPSTKVQKLYGSTFHNFTPTQKKFIKDNLDTIQEITQRTLTRRGYPEGAGRTGQQGTNVVSFNLHPNGNISNLRLKTRIGYRSLDDNTLSLIRVAYMDYPYPTTTTKIIFYVTYSIYGY